MPFDTSTRNRLADFVKDARDLITAEFTLQFSELYGIAADGTLTPVAQLAGHLDENGLATAALLRERIAYLVRTHPEERGGPAVAVTRLAREQAFTILNRLAAVRMSEKRGLILPSVGKGYQSDGFRIYDTVAGKGLGDAYHRYRRYLFCLFDELALELGVLFNRHAPQGLLFPRETALLALLDLLNAHDLEGLWAEDETIGWIYQYYNDPLERKKMREQSAAPRNSRELAVRNQFFTPRYVVEFLTDNTLGRIWYEMTGGRTVLKEKCRYLVRRPMEVFLAGPAEVYQQLFSKQADATDMKPHGWVAEAFTGQLQNLVEKAGDPDTRWVGSAIRPRDFDILAGEPCPAFGDHRLHRLSEAILEGRETDDTQNLVLVWAALSDFHRCDGSRGYSASNWEKVWSHFRKLAQRPVAENISHNELLTQPVFIPYRPLKDPRTILMLDPACGSMHFGLYAFDIFEIIYHEAWELEEKFGAAILVHPPGMKSLRETFATKEEFLRQVPRLIIERNIHGIDIDPRCAQIAGLSLWLRAQRAWKDMGLKPADRPTIKHSNIVCAEPMPGEKSQLKEFCDSLKQPVIGRMVEMIFDKMSLAGEAGSLLKIEEEIRDLVHNTKLKWTETYRFDQAKEELFSKAEIAAVSKAKKSDGAELNIDFSGITDETFWEKAEERIYDALRDYAEQAESGGGFQRRLFAEDAARGFAFIDLCRKRYDVALMNPPFGAFSQVADEILNRDFLDCRGDLYPCFMQRWGRRSDMLGAITNRTGLTLSGLAPWRVSSLLTVPRLILLADLGMGVLDALVETALFVLGQSKSEFSITLDLLATPKDKASGILLDSCSEVSAGKAVANCFVRNLDAFRKIPGSPICYRIPFGFLNTFLHHPSMEHGDFIFRSTSPNYDDFRFMRLRWEAPPSQFGRAKRWSALAKGGEYRPYYADIELLIDWDDNRQTFRGYTGSVHRPMERPACADIFFSPGITWSGRTYAAEGLHLTGC